MTVAIRKIAGTDRDYLAYPRKFAGRATCFAYFQDDLCGAVALHNFAPDAAPALAPASAASLRRTGSLPQAYRRPRTPPPVIRWPRSHRTAAPQVTIRCRETPAMPLPTSRRQATTCSPDLHGHHRHAPI